MNIKQALVISGLVLSNQVNANSSGLSEEVNRNKLKTNSGVEIVLGKISELKQNCNLESTKTEKKGLTTKVTEKLSCVNGSSSIQSEIKKSKFKITYRGQNYSCADLVSKIIVNGQIITEIKHGEGSIIISKNEKLLMEYPCSDLITN
ncbi:MAG: hypothetical protein PHH98_01210 [Candidatus Gracilibacteria bacterium]|nr:hypothetical protein [Candidatus Gracilibacteria bacterium]